MEEILASIRQIISEDGEGAPTPRSMSGHMAQPKSAAPPREERLAQPAEDVAQPSGLAADSPDASSGSAEADAQPAPQALPTTSAAQEPRRVDAAFMADRPAAAPDRPAPERQSLAPQHTHQAEDRKLLSQHSDAAVSGAFSALAHTILAQNARTLEDLVSEMLRPMLKEWLDDNLPPLVERLVQEEIQRVSRGRR
jgi:cell pole-organizing protein PopZ